ncbi:MAG: HAMP domain-containing sensor histidine kinase, partial [bacterium]|nr:HAMP domain-containing sensor histidine kinase [bacterium]
MSSCVLLILIMQAFWIRNSFFQKRDEFDRSVYGALEQISAKIQERENLKVIRETYFISNGDTIAHTPSRKMSFASDEEVNVIHQHDTEVRVTRVITPKSNSIKRKIHDSVMFVSGNQNLNIVLNDAKKTRIIVRNKADKKQELKKDPKKGDEQENEIERLVDKMMMEIKINGPEKENKDTLQGLIKKALRNKGILIPFEFSLRKITTGKTDTISQSSGFNEKERHYESDLSMNKVFSTHNFLWLQFPRINDHVLVQMKNSLLLTAFFTLLIMLVFYYTLRLISKQKKIAEIKNDFVNNMTHELKTPIATIRLALDAIGDPRIRNNEDRYRDYVRILKEENSKLNTHVERVLQMSLLEKGELHLNKKPIDLRDIIQASINTYGLQIAEHKAELIFETPAEPFRMNGDEQHLQSVFNNLLDNALKYSSDKCKIEIGLSQNDEKIEIIIKDNGIGIDKEYRDRIFDKFFRVQGGNLHDVKGFGLGLSYVKSIVEKHGGRIEMKSEPGKGT